MSALPTDPLTRLAELETRLAAVEADLRNTRRRGAESVTARETWPAVTAELADWDEQNPSYPRWDADDADQLPVIMLDGIVTGGSLSWDERSPDPRIVALSPVGWLPPGTRVEVGFDGRRFRIVQAPGILDGLAGDGYTTADWAAGNYYADECDELDLGWGVLHVFEEDSEGVLVPQYYADGEAVEMKFWNIAGVGDGNTLIEVARDRFGRWKVIVDPCDVECTSYQ